MVAKSKPESTELVEAEIVDNLPAVIDWRDVDSWDIACNLPQGILDSTHVLGDGSILITKDDMLGVDEFIVLDWHENIDKETGNIYTNVLVIDKMGRKARFNDGSTGIAAQLRDYEEKYGKIPLHCHGVRVSEYMHKNEKGEKSKARTFYLK